MAAKRRHPQVLRYAAFADDPVGGNPAGVVLDADHLAPEEMQAIAARVKYSETAFVVPRSPEGRGPRGYDVRYFTPETEVPFCGHATIAAAAALAGRDGPGSLVFHVQAGEVAVEAEHDGGVARATLTSVAPRIQVPEGTDVADALDALGWTQDDLDPRLPPRIAYAGARHLLLFCATRGRLAVLDYDYAALAEVSRRLELITVALVWRQDATTLHARNLGPGVGIREDPATGAAAAALGGSLEALGEISSPASLTVLQGFDMGRPSRLLVEAQGRARGVRVTGAAVPIPETG